MAPSQLTVVIERSELSSCKVAGISLTDRLIKNCISEGITEIYVMGGGKGSFSVSANEKTATVQEITNLSGIPDKDRMVFFVRDNVVIRDRLIKQVFRDCRPGRYQSASGQDLFVLDRLDKIEQGVEALADFPVLESEFTLCEGPLDVEHADQRLFKWLYKPSDGIVTVKIDRPISRIFSRLFARLPFSPAFYTYVNGLQGLLMLWFFLQGGSYAVFLGCMMYQVVAVFDCVDGEIARAKFQQSEAGARLDTSIDMISNILFMGGLSYALWNIHGDSYVMLGSSIVMLVLLGIGMMTALLYFGPKGGSFDVLALVIRKRLHRSHRLTNLFTGINYVMKRDFFALIFAILGMTGQALLIPYSLVGGLVIWNVAILFNARSILRYRYS